MACLQKPIELKTHNRFYNQLYEFREATTTYDQKEIEILSLIRKKGFKLLSIKLNDGNILSAEGEEEISCSDLKRLLQIIEQHKYQTVKIVQHDGKTVRLTRKVSFKFSDSKDSSMTPPTEKT